MSLQFSDTSGGRGIIQTIEKNCGFNRGDISGNATLLADFTADVNLALDIVTALIIDSSGQWNYDDSNQTDYPIISTNLVSGQRDYAFTVDGSGNLILEIKRVTCADPSGTFHELIPVNQQKPTLQQGNSVNTDAFYNGKNASGTPNRYDKTANGIFLDVIPNYNSTGGLKMYIDREASYFLTSDTTKKPGFAGLFHEYLALRPAYQYAYRKVLANASLLNQQMLLMERAIQNYYSKRDRDVQKRFIANVEPTR